MDRALFSEISAMLRPLQRKLRNQVNRVVVSLATDSTGTQKTQANVLSGEVMEQEHMQPGGLTHVPLPGAEGLFVTVSGVRDDGVMICVSDRRYRPKGLQAGETALYNDAPAITQSKILLKLDGSIEVIPATGKGVLIGGSAATQAQVLGNVLQTVLSALTVPTAMGPSGTPINAASFSTFLSATHKIDS
jgi:phage baseplate assembly protein V